MTQQSQAYIEGFREGSKPWPLADSDNPYDSREDWIRYIDWHKGFEAGQNN